MKTEAEIKEYCNEKISNCETFRNGEEFSEGGKQYYRGMAYGLTLLLKFIEGEE